MNKIIYLPIIGLLFLLSSTFFLPSFGGSSSSSGGGFTDANFFFLNKSDINWPIFNQFFNPSGGVKDVNIENNLTIDTNIPGKFHNTLDVNGPADFNQGINSDSNITLSTTTAKLNGWYQITISGNTTTCTDFCDALDVNTGSNFTCIDSWPISSTATHVLCSNSAGTRNCLCKN